MFGVEIMVQDCPRCTRPCEHDADINSVLSVGYCTACEHREHDAMEAFNDSHGSDLTTEEMNDMGTLL